MPRRRRPRGLLRQVHVTVENIRRVGGQWLGRQATNGPEGDGAGVATKEHLHRRDRRAGSYRCAHTGELEEPCSVPKVRMTNWAVMSYRLSSAM